MTQGTLRRLMLPAAIAFACGVAAVLLRLRSTGPMAAPVWPEFAPMDAANNGSTAPPPAAHASTTSGGWRPPAEDGVAPDGYPVKVKVSSGIFHVPGGRFYDRTLPDRCYPTAVAAEADGYRPSKA